LEKYRIDTPAMQEIRWRRIGVFDTGKYMLMYSGKESNTVGTGFLINRAYKQTSMNLKAVDETICSLKMRRKFNMFTIISVRAPMEENDELVYGKCNQRYQGIPA
jgi:hypothetical protein